MQPWQCPDSWVRWHYCLTLAVGGVNAESEDQSQDDEKSSLHAAPISHHCLMEGSGPACKHRAGPSDTDENFPLSSQVDVFFSYPASCRRKACLPAEATHSPLQTSHKLFRSPSQGTSMTAQLVYYRQIARLRKISCTKNKNNKK